MNIKEFLLSNKAKTFYWQTANGVILLIIAYVTDISWVYAAPAIALLNAATKFINVNYLQK